MPGAQSDDCRIVFADHPIPARAIAEHKLGLGGIGSLAQNLLCPFQEGLCVGDVSCLTGEVANCFFIFVALTEEDGVERSIDA